MFVFYKWYDGWWFGIFIFYVIVLKKNEFIIIGFYKLNFLYE